MNGGERRRVCLGAVAGAHGVGGALKLRAFTEREENLAAYGPLESEDGRRRLHIEIIRVLNPGLVLARAREIATREEAEALAGMRLYVDRDALPPAAAGEYYIEDLIGLAAVDEDGAPLGAIAALHDFGAGPILELRRTGSRDALFIPFTDAAAPAIDLGARRIVLNRAAVDAAGGGGGATR